MDKYKFGEFIYQRRKMLHITQEELGSKLGVTNKAVSKWETGETYPDIQMLDSLARVLNVSIDELLTQKPYVDSEKKRSKKLTIVLIVINIALIILSVVMSSIVIPTLVASGNKKDSIELTIKNYQNYLYLEYMDGINFNDSNKITINTRISLNSDYNCDESSMINIETYYQVHTYFIDNDGNEMVYSYINRQVNYTIDSSNSDCTVLLNLIPNSELSITKYLGITVDCYVAKVSGFLKEAQNEK